MSVHRYFDTNRAKIDRIHDGLVDKLVEKLSGRGSEFYPFFEYPKGIEFVRSYFPDFIPVTRINDKLGNEIAINGEVDLVEFDSRSGKMIVFSYEVKSTEDGNGRYPKSKVIKRARKQLNRFERFMGNVLVEPRLVYAHDDKLNIAGFENIKGSNILSPIVSYSLF